MSLDLRKGWRLGRKSKRAIKSQIAVVVSAGKYQRDASTSTLCKSDEAHCVGAINEQHDRAPYSNYGPKATIWALDDEVRAYHNDGQLRDDHEGTSFAAQYVSGIIATFYGREGRVKQFRGLLWDTYTDLDFDNAKAYTRLESKALSMCSMVTAFPRPIPWRTTDIREDPTATSMPRHNLACISPLRDVTLQFYTAYTSQMSAALLRFSQRSLKWVTFRYGPPTFFLPWWICGG